MVQKVTRLKANSKKTLDIIATQKTRNATQAYLQTHPNASYQVALNESSKLLAKPSAQIYLQEHVDLLNSDKDDIRLRSATDILDRSTGKAIQRTENVSTGITLNIDLMSALDDSTEVTDV